MSDDKGGRKRIIVIAGPTASGKTRLAVALAQRLGAPILSADSRQVYRELDIGVAKPTAAELAAAEHHLISYVSVDEDYSAGRWARDATATLELLFELHDVCIVAGGSGLHVRALLEGIPDMPAVPEDTRARYEDLYRRRGIASLQDLLRERDPAYAAVVDLANPHRLQRALAAMDASGETFTALRARPHHPLPYRADWVVLEPDRETLYAQIDRRVERMFAAGLVEEARGLSPKRHLDALQTIGYREVWPLLDGEVDEAAAVSAVQRATRRYARRQMTWNRRLGGLRLDGPDADAVLAHLGLPSALP